MNFPSKSKVNVSAANNHKFDLSKTHVTTHDFGRVKAIDCRYMVPGDKFNVELSSFTRLLPMVSPTFGKIDTVQRAYFVPIRTLIPKFYDWVSNQPTPAYDGTWSTDSVIPHTKMKSFVAAFCQAAFSTELVVGEEDPTPSDGEYDFLINVSQGDFSNYNDIKDVTGSYVSPMLSAGAHYFKFTPLGRKIYDFFISLGLNINFEPSYKNVNVSLLPILAFWKAYIDWIVPSRFIKEYPVNIKYVLMYLSSDEYGQSGEADFTTEKSALQWFINNLMHYPLSFYDNDYFTSAWLKPFQQEVMANDIFIPNGSSFSGDHLNSVQVDPVENSGAVIQADNSLINYFTIQSLGKLQDYLNRGMLAGSKVQDWLTTEFGIRPSTDALNLSTYLGKVSDTIMIDDIYSSSDTSGISGQKLGSYAGRAKKGTYGKFNYSSREHGFFIITNEIIPKTSYSQGLIPEFNMIDRFDFFQPEFDNMGVQAVSHKELFCSVQKYVDAEHLAETPQLLDPESIFGFVPRYANLKTSFDCISGDFKNRFGTYLKSWYLNRDVEKMLSDSVRIGDGVISLDWATIDKDTQFWDNIFDYNEDDIDHFYQIFVIAIKASRPMISLEDALNPEHPNGSKNVTIKTHGGVE